jgi:hypothetical protein
VHEHRNRADLIDTFSILIESRSSGQVTASDDEIYQALALLMSWSTDVTLLFDGVDECINAGGFLTKLHELCTKSYTKVLLLGRPSTEIPRSFRHFTSFHLDQSQNMGDIALYLRPEIHELQQDGQLEMCLSLDEIVSILTSRSQGMFLWAWLMVRYLECKALSPSEREEAIFTVELVEGLENLYEKILFMLRREYRKTQEKLGKIFSLMVASTSPLTITQLQIALAIEPGMATKKSRFIKNLAQDLPIICGSLVEIHPAL